MADSEWYEIPGDGGEYPNAESVYAKARRRAESTDDCVEVYRCTRTLVRSFQRTVTVEESTPTVE
ncbi:hypothetical protein [Streptomyces achromogenes]|uniref:hypothetical protein n=1 Tax=Streptomyces achromogenes TaxID=67255 RepID=UPI0036A40B0A